MSGFTSSKSWGEELRSLVEDTGSRYNADTVGVPTPAFETEMPGFTTGEAEEGESESFKDHVKGFAKASLGRNGF